MALVAKSYQGLKQIGDVYSANGKMYIKVELANGNLKQVRAYSDKEWAKYYGTPIDHSNDPYYKTQREVLGFVDGFITIFKGNTYEHKEWFKENGATYTKHWGWSFASNVEVPTELPEGVEAIKLQWSAVGADENSLMSDERVKSAVEALTCEPSNSQFQGSIGERLELDITVVKALAVESQYGNSMCYTMKDANENEYVWFTSSVKTQLKEGETCRIRGTVKQHKTYRNVNQTYLSRCAKVVKK